MYHDLCLKAPSGDAMDLEGPGVVVIEGAEAEPVLGIWAT